MTVVVSLHELSLVSGFADRVVMLEHGRSIASGSPAETLSEQRVAEVFDLSLVRVRHPQGDRELSFFEKRAAC
jgi:iron complex transport system ATP-binding protein